MTAGPPTYLVACVRVLSRCFYNPESELPMKQTKPYGKAYAASDRTEKYPRRQEQPRSVPPIVARSTAPASSVTVSAVSPARTPQSLSGVDWMMKKMAQLVLGVTLCTAYVYVRDSTIVQNFINQVSNFETVMKCEEGRVEYQDWSVWDRLMGNGRFVCTDWKVQSRFVNPRPF